MNIISDYPSHVVLSCDASNSSLRLSNAQFAILNALAYCKVFNYFHFSFITKSTKHAYTNNLHQLIINQRDSYGKNPSSVDTLTKWTLWKLKTYWRRGWKLNVIIEKKMCYSLGVFRHSQAMIFFFERDKCSVSRLALELLKNLAERFTCFWYAVKFYIAAASD